MEERLHDSLRERLRYDHGAPEAMAMRNERRAWVAVGLTLAMMLGELGVGYWSGSMALTADGWHMGTHAGALAITGVAYWFARTRSSATEFSFGTGKVYALAGYTNAALLLLAALWVIGESLVRLFNPVTIHFDVALGVAVLGLIVNLVCAVILQPAPAESGAAHSHAHSHGHGHSHGHASEGSGQDANLRGAYLHVIADAVTSVAAIIALLAGRFFGWNWLDALVGVLGGALILRWGVGLARDAGRELLDMVPRGQRVDAIRQRLEAIDDVRVVDLHLWEMGFGRRVCVVSLVTDRPQAVSVYRAAVQEVLNVAHLTVEVHRCEECPP